jgi:hypothetical protein
MRNTLLTSMIVGYYGMDDSDPIYLNRVARTFVNKENREASTLLKKRIEAAEAKRLRKRLKRLEQRTN